MTYLQPFNAWCKLDHTYLTNLQLKTTSLLKFVGPISEHQALKGCESQLCSRGVLEIKLFLKIHSKTPRPLSRVNKSTNCRPVTLPVTLQFSKGFLGKIKRCRPFK